MNVTGTIRYNKVNLCRFYRCGIPDGPGEVSTSTFSSPRLNIKKYFNECRKFYLQLKYDLGLI